MTTTVKETIDSNIDKMFTDLVKEYDLEYGDISPEQVLELDAIKEYLYDSLGDLLGDWVYNNLPETGQPQSLAEQEEANV